MKGKNQGNKEMMNNATLSEKECEILNLAAQGLSNYEISDALGCTYHSVKCYLYRINNKFDTRNRSAAIAKAVKMGIIKIGGN